MQGMWNHCIWQLRLSHMIMSPNDGRRHTHQVFGEMWVATSWMVRALLAVRRFGNTKVWQIVVARRLMIRCVTGDETGRAIPIIFSARVSERVTEIKANKCTSAINVYNTTYDVLMLAISYLELWLRFVMRWIQNCNDVESIQPSFVVVFLSLIWFGVVDKPSLLFTYTLWWRKKTNPEYDYVHLKSENRLGSMHL